MDSLMQGLRKIEEMESGDRPEFLGRILEKIEYKRGEDDSDFPDQYWFIFGNNIDAMAHVHCLPEAQYFDFEGNERFVGLRVKNARRHEIDGSPAFSFVFEGGPELNFIYNQKRQEANQDAN